MHPETAKKMIESMRTPNFKMVSILLMAALYCMEDDQKVMTKKMQIMSSKLGELATKLSAPLNAVFLANMITWQLPDNQGEFFFLGDDLSFQGMMNIATEGANGWHAIYQSGAIEKSEMKKFYECIKEAIQEVVAISTPDDKLIPQILAAQDGLIKLYS